VKLTAMKKCRNPSVYIGYSNCYAILKAIS